MSPGELSPTDLGASAPLPETDSESLRHSSLAAEHVALGAKLVPFGGWMMPLAYGSGTLAEHRACRSSAVAFDVSHLGTVRLEGPHAFESLQYALTNDLRKVTPGRAQYTHLLDDSDASVLDDLIVWWISDAVFDVMPNASNTSRVRDAVGGEDTTASRAVIAVQGPQARRLLSSVARDAAAVPRFSVTTFEWKGFSCLSAGTGYTGEDGVECAVPVEGAADFWRSVIAAGVAPAGLGARDTLRLEAGLPLHGHELGRGITPLQAGLGWVVGWDKGDFRGRNALDKERSEGPRRRLRGVVGAGRQPLREGATVHAAHEIPATQATGTTPEPKHPGGSSDDPSGAAATVGEVTSGNYSPVLDRGIAMAFIDTATGIDDGSQLELELRGRRLPAQVTRLPFVAHHSTSKVTAR